MKFKIIERKADCVLLYKAIGNDAKYIAKDIEGDIIYMNLNDLAGAKRAFEAYDINKVRETKQREFEEWLSENAEA